jgi:hypothetical protein
MRRLLVTRGTIVLMLAPATSAPTAVEQFRDSRHHEVHSGHDINISGELATFTFDVTGRVHAVDNGTTFQAAYSESFKYALVRPGHLQQFGRLDRRGRVGSLRTRCRRPLPRDRTSRRSCIRENQQSRRRYRLPCQAAAT